MTIERRNPLPVGVYWADFYEPPVGGASIDAFKRWLTNNAGDVRLRTSVYHGPGVNPLLAMVQGAWSVAPGLAAIANQLPGSGTARVWALFEVLTPGEVTYPQKEFGYPTIAPRGLATGEDDTVQKPPAEKDFPDRVGDALDDLGESAGSLAKVAALVGGLVAAVWVVGVFTRR